MKTRSILSFAILAAIGFNFSGCGDDNPEVPVTHQATLGQQLTDLEEARQQRLISDRELSRLKKALIKRYQ